MQVYILVVLRHELQIIHIISILCCRFVETDGKGYDRVRRTEIGKKHFKLTHFEEVSMRSHLLKITRVLSEAVQCVFVAISC